MRASQKIGSCGTIGSMGTDAERTWIIERAKRLGFDLCGVLRAERFPELHQFEEWLERGYAGEMKYLEDPRRANPELVMQDLRSVIVCALNYNTAHPYSTEAAASATTKGSLQGWMSRYAWGDDYHEVMWGKLNALAEALKEKFPGPFTTRAYADTGPAAERVFAKYAGLGWLGKNTLLLNEKHGSWLFLGVIFTSLDLAAVAWAGGRTSRGFMRELPAMPGCVSNRCTHRAVRVGRTAVYFLSNDRTPWQHTGGIPRGDGVARLRVRHLSGRLSVQSPGSRYYLGGISAPPEGYRKKSYETEFGMAGSDGPSGVS